MNRIILRADGTASIGYGHVHRLLSLAQMLHHHFECVFVSHEAPAFLLDELQKLSMAFVQTASVQYKFPDEKAGEEEIDFDMDAILTGSEIVVLDGYWFGKKYQQQIKNKGCTLVYIDDLIAQGAIADCIINHSLGINNSDYKHTAAATCIYTGAAYSLVNVPETFRQKQWIESNHNQLLIAMGGADPLNFTAKVIGEYKSYIQQFEKAIVLVGNAYAHLQELEQIIATFPSIEIKQGISKEAVFSIMQQSDAAILSASTMAVEYANIGGALAIIQTATNQQFLYKGLLQNEVALPVEKIATATDDTIKKMREHQQSVFDGKSAERFSRLFKELELQQSLSFIPAAKEQVVITYRWAADASVRAYSFNRNEISFEEHSNWYLNKIQQPSCMYLLAVSENNIAGSIRFDISADVALISYLVDPQCQGKGLGRIILAKGLEYLSKNNHTVSRAEGFVIPENLASVKIFERLGFTADDRGDRILFTKNIYR